MPDDALAEVRERRVHPRRGVPLFEGADRREQALQLHFPNPEDYFAEPARYADYARSQFAGVEEFPYRSWDLNRLAFHPDLVDAAERYLGTDQLHLYKVELWAKYAGAVDYTQPLHRDYGSHSLVVPRPEARYQQITSFIFLSDVTGEDGPTHIVPFDNGKDVPYTPLYLELGALADVEFEAVGPAGTLFMYRTDILHRGSDFTGAGRIALLATCRLPGSGYDLGREDDVAQAVAATLGQTHAALQRARARPLRLPSTRRRLLDRTDAG